MAEHSHTDHTDGGVHVHVHSWKLYAGILGALLFLTVITVAAAYVDIDGFIAFGGEVEGVGAWNMTVAVLIATSKAALVVMFFMHLKDDSRFNALILIGSLLFIGIFFAYTMNDTTIRGTMDRYNGVVVDPDTGVRAPGGIAGPIPGEVLERGLPEPEAPAEAAPTEQTPAQGVAAEEAAADEAAAVAEETALEERAEPAEAPAEAAPVEGAAPSEGAAGDEAADQAGAGEGGADEAAAGGADEGAAGGADEAAAGGADEAAAGDEAAAEPTAAE